MRKRVFLFTTLIVLAGLLCFFFVSIYITQEGYLNIAKDTVMETARICANLYSDETDAASFVKAGGDVRITIISSEGNLIADSRPIDISAVENHLDRPEVQAALNDAPEAHVRRSGTLGVDFVYYALKQSSGAGYVFIRAAVPVAKVGGYLSQSLPLLILVTVAIALLSLVLSRSLIRRIVKPFESVERRLGLLLGGEYSAQPVARSYEEIDAVAQDIEDIAQLLQSSFASMREEKSKADYILNNISDGIFIVDESKNISLVNSAALTVFDVTPEIAGKNVSYLSYDETLIAAVDDCVARGKSSLFELALGGKIYLVTVKRLPGTEFTMVVLSDISDGRENEKRREDFFANASHELKTPLTAIKGFNELTAINNKDERVGKYIESITRETDRMLALIDDMLKLSELENTRGLNSVPVSLAGVAGEVCDTLSVAISGKSITVNSSGDALVSAEPGHVYDLVKNLVENAVRYSDQGGSVSIKIESEKKGAALYVIDDGIGISPGEQTRIFERFYRVEKSRSQRSGGTGLGLSIVKHICATYGWELSLKSKLGVGTEVKVAFGRSERIS
ncbi:MAG: ATP-binding protein [Oscillospiraceae bacterium]|nr:ATP-binding protein [Oscillospiraceae bacterium]